MLDQVTVDALVVGAGFGGIYATYSLARMGLDVKCIDIAGDVGGTWYWNSYPGAMSDTQSYLYRFSWDKEDLQTYPWSSQYLYQPEILQYLRHVVDKHDLRRFMNFNVEMTTATWDESISRWCVTTADGKTLLARYLITCLGVLSKANYPQIAGLETFSGRIVHTARWDDNIELEDKKVGVIGNGSTGIQVMTAISPIVKQLTSFQRHPQYSVPSGQGLVLQHEREQINNDYDNIWNRVRSSAIGFGVPEVTRKTMEATPKERQQAFQEAWDQGNGFRFMFSAFGDLVSDEVANEEACEFIRQKIDTIVTDPRKAAILKPRDLYARRPLCDTGYYQIFNKHNVDVVDLKTNPIAGVVKQGIELEDGSIHKLDVLIFATGFDAIEGNYLRLSIAGRDGETIQAHWQTGPTAFGGIACSGFPNMFLVSGPQAPFANFPPVIESEIEFIMSCIAHAEKSTSDDAAKPLIEATKEAENEWAAVCDGLTQGLLFRKTASWVFGENVPGRKAVTKFYFGGLGNYRKWVEDVITDGFRGFNISQ